MNNIEKYLGKPEISYKNLIIYNRDCLSSMQQLPKEIIDLTITSPPYNIGKEYETILETTTYIEWCQQWIKEVHRLTKINGTFWLNVGYLEVQEKGKAVPISYLLWDKSNFYLMQEIVWNYSAGVACRKRFSPRNEKLLWYVKNKNNYTFNLDDIRDKNVKYPNQKKNGKLRCNPLGKNPTDVWQIPKVTSGRNRSSRERTSHPAQSPIQMIDRIIKCSSNPGDIVLDPFTGSGTTAEAALNNDRFFIGFETNNQYLEIIKDRLRV